MITKNNHILLLLSVLILLPFFEYGIDYLIGDKDGKIATFNISLIIKLIQVFIIIFLSISFYKLQFSYFLAFIISTYFVIDFSIIGRILYDYEYIHRYPHPYVGFTGKPKKGNHNEFGFLGPKISDAKNDEFIIAFFGGSTGYRGNPSLPILIKNYLNNNNFMNKKIFISNFSTESSNHNQHLHMLTEYILTFNVDLIIFYGGWNETVGQTGYDPRPGYPLNFFYIHDEPHWKKILIENSKIFRHLQHKIVNREQYDQIVYSKTWNQNIINNYFNTLYKANLFTKIIEPNLMEKTKFLSFYQPFYLDRVKQIMPIHKAIKEKSKSTPYLYDISDLITNFDESFTDEVHVNQKARVEIAKTISELIIKSYNEKSNLKN